MVMGKKLYMEVTMDKYSIPLAVADTPRELAKLRGVTNTQVLTGLNKSERYRYPRFVKVEVEDEQDEDPEN